MSSRVHLAVLLVVACATVPSLANAGWGSKGGHEPDTTRDVEGGLMFLDHDITPCGTQASPQYCSSNQVYFNGWEGHEGSFNPNVATERTAISGQSYSFYALLGVWKDCNNDGFIGLGDQGLFEYRSELLAQTSLTGGPGTTICPPTVTPVNHVTGKPPLNWMPSHNDGQWVREFLPFSWLDVNSVVGDTDPYNINANGVRVWVDYGYPEKVYTPNMNCWIGTYPRGTFHSTGALIETFDCNDGNRITDTIDLVADSNAVLRPYSFSDHSRDQHNSGSQLNKQNPWGVPSDKSYADVWDCGQPPLASAPPVNLGTLGTVYVNVSAPSRQPTTHVGGSPSGTLNVTESGFDRCTPRTDTGAPTGANAPYALEGNVLQPLAKVQSTGVMTPNEDNRPAAPFSAVLGPGTPTPDATDAGTSLHSASGLWRDQLAGHLLEGPLTDSNTGFISAVQPVTYYAYVDPAAVQAYGLTLPPAGPQTYGAEACTGFTSGVHNEWDCDATHWWRDVNGNDISFRAAALGRDPNASPTAPCTPGAGLTSTTSRGCMPISPTPGSTYNLRDVDCYDQSAGPLRQNGVQYGIFTGTACDEATN